VLSLVWLLLYCTGVASSLCRFFSFSIKKLKKKLEQKRTETKDRKQEKQKWTPFTYFSPLVRKVTNIFKDTEIKIAYRSTNTIFKQLAKKNR